MDAGRLPDRETTGQGKIRQRVPRQGEEEQVHRGAEDPLQVAVDEGGCGAPAEERDRDPVSSETSKHSPLVWILLG